MREDYALREEVVALVDALFESRLDVEEAKHLEGLVTRNPLACRYYLEIVGLYEGLYCWSRESGASLPKVASQEEVDVLRNWSDLDVETLWGIAPSGQPEVEEEPPANPTLGFLSDCFKGGVSFLGRNVVLLVVLLPLLAIGIVAWMSPTLWGPKWTLAARVMRTVDCRWEQGGDAPGKGSFLVPGQKLNLQGGVVEIEFSSGAKVVLQGPMQFVIDDENGSTLSLGRLAAVVPKGAEGFMVRTPGMNVTDLGTEFGVSVDADDMSDVHVFKGVVEMEASTKSGGTKSIRLKKNEAAIYDRISGSLVPVSVDANKFVRNIEDIQGVTMNLRVINPSFEVPDIRTEPKYRPEYGDTKYLPIHGWKTSTRDQKRSLIAKYQILPFSHEKPGRVIPMPATDGRQGVTIALGVSKKSTGEDFRVSWLFQSLGVITSADVGKKLKLSVDAGAKSQKDASRGKGTMFAGFALNVTTEQIDARVGEFATFEQQGTIKQLRRLKSVAPITANLVGQELFIVLGVHDDGSGQGKDQYHFDHVQVVVEK